MTTDSFMAYELAPDNQRCLEYSEVTNCKVIKVGPEKVLMFKLRNTPK